MPGLLSSHHSFLTWIFSSQCGYFPYPSLHSHLHCPLPPPLTQDQTSPQNPQTWLKGNTSSAWSLSPPSLLPCHISIANTIFFKWTSPLSQPPSCPALRPCSTHSPYHERRWHDTDTVLQLLSSNSSSEEVPSIRIIIHGHPSSKAVLHKLFPHTLVSQLLRWSTLSIPLSWLSLHSHSSFTRLGSFTVKNLHMLEDWQTLWLDCSCSSSSHNK